MADEFDVDALLEAPYKETKSSDRAKSDSRDERRSKDKRSSRSTSRDRGHRSSRDRGSSRRRSRSRDRSRRDRSRDRGGSSRRSRSRDRGSSRRDRSPRGGAEPRRRYRSKSKSPEMPLTPEERDARTIFCMQLSQRCRARDIEEFFSSVGKIKDVKLIMCNKTRRFKGIAYVEFKELDSIPLALGLSGQKICGVPVIVQPSQAEKNRIGQYNEPPRPKEKGPMRLYVGSLHFNITEDMLKGIFEPFGRIQSIQLIQDSETGRSKGYGFITYCEAEDAKKALEQMNGFELAGRPMKVGNVTERNDALIGPAGFDADDMERAGIDLGTTGRLALMAKLAEGTGMRLPQAANQALTTAAEQQKAMIQAHAGPHMPSSTSPSGQQRELSETQPPIATQCFMLSNMFDPATETQPGWDVEVRDDVIEECDKQGGVAHIAVDVQSPEGRVYVKAVDIPGAVAAVNALHGRWFAGKVITAAYVPLVNYHNLFPEAIAMSQQLQPTRR